MLETIVFIVASKQLVENYRVHLVGCKSVKLVMFRSKNAHPGNRLLRQ